MIKRTEATAEAMREQALAVIREISQHEQEHGTYGVKAAVYALSELAAHAASIRCEGSAAECREHLVAGLSEFRREYSSDLFVDEYGAAVEARLEAFENGASRPARVRGGSAETPPPR